MSADTRHHTILTPEGVELRFLRANLGDRAAAFLIDTGIIVVSVLAFVVLGAILGGGDLLMAIAMLAMFLIRMFYFTGFEWRWRGRTPGKKRIGLQVIDAHGGALDARAIIARNLTRELELFLPLVALFSPQLLVADAPPWVSIACTLWLLVFLCLPVITRDRLRLGDLVAGTRVVAAPTATLLPDLVERVVAAPIFSFTEAQLSHYGNRELLVLEDVLRRPYVEPATLALIRDKILSRIGWTDTPPADTRRFLEDFYSAQRARLERGLLFGRRHADKAEARAAHRPSRPSR